MNHYEKQIMQHLVVTGSHLCERLVHHRHHVLAIDNLSTGRLENINHLRPLPNFQFVRETITNLQVLDRLTSDVNLAIEGVTT
ncbi:MAG: hypothetical protein KKD28_09510 [Chloroflexi bacterium]|nr:hypothetical protein [Chloroflexota bacterium]MBU1661695.1 hypothetical protein [Chloroflexota bacterium]